MKKSIIDLILLFIIILLAFVSGHAAQATNVNSSIAFETRSPSPGSSVRIAIIFKPNEGWHTYWTNPGDAGAAPRAKWNAPDGFDFSEPRHPVPSLLSVDGIASFVHKGDHALLLNMRIPQDASIGSPIPIDLNLDWLSCSDTQCVPERASLKAMLVVGKGETDFVGLSRIRKAEAELPRPLSGVTFQRDQGDWVFVIPGNISGAMIFPDDNRMFEPASMQSFYSAEGKSFVRVSAAPGSDGRDTFSGVIRSGKGNFRVSEARRKVVVNEDILSSEVKPAVEEDPILDDVSLGSDIPQAGVEKATALESETAKQDEGQSSEDTIKGKPLVLWGFILLGAMSLIIFIHAILIEFKKKKIESDPL